MPGVDLHMKGVGMLVVSLRGVNFLFWSNLGCSGHYIRSHLGCSMPLYSAVKVSLRVAREEIIFNMYIFHSFYLIFDSYSQSFL